MNSERSHTELIGRFAPSPSGRFHIGNIFSSMIASLVADRMILRIEDLDPDRSKQEHIDAIMRDLDWFGFEWVGDVLYQSSQARQEAYFEALTKLDAKGLIYPCFCSRADLHSAQAPHTGEEYLYQNTCKFLSNEERASRALTRDPALRLAIPDDLKVQEFDDLFQGVKRYNLQETSGDFIVRRSDGVFAYQLAVVVDDATSGVNSVVRGADLLSSTPKQMLIQELLGYPESLYGHVPIIVDEMGRKLSKRNKDATLSYLIDELRMSSCEILGYLSYLSGIIPDYEPMDLVSLKKFADLSNLDTKMQIIWKAPLK